uniref:TIR domain-containing protein n=1 Tax=Kalanchoe fedtschenkoi TaxID=63787 RepID=A0A7N0TEW5_KALFE
MAAHHVFLSFRGEDVRRSFIDHLRLTLTHRGITVFYDDKGLERGEEIQSKLYEAIESSEIAIVTFSPKYAGSRWCLDELVKIMERRTSHGLTVLPVFYGVDPTNVRKQSESFREAFHVHEANYGDERVRKWRQALTTAADLAGFALQDQANGYEAQFIQHIAKEVERRVDAGQLAIPEYMVGADSLLIQGINKWLQNGSSQVEVGIIYGPGGVGKTTTAKVVYNENYRRFESASFLAGVRNAHGNDVEFIRLQKQLIHNITWNEVIHIDSVHEGRQKIKRAIGIKKILIVLDDVDEEVGLDKMFDCPDWFFSGSKILMTTRNRHLLINDKSIARFEACLLDEKCSVELFSYYGFGQPAPLEDYVNISMSFIEYCDGLPLALEVLASSLRNIRFEMWELEFARLEEYLDEKVNNVLKWSFDSIQQSTVKDIFLHVAFYMVGMKREFALWILDGCGLHGKIGLENLIGKCLVSVSEYHDTLMMHQLIQQMGYEIVRQESPIELGRRSRLLLQKDAYEVLWKKTATPTIKGLFLNIPNALDGDISSDENYARHSTKRMRMTYIPTNPSRQVPQQFRPIKTDAFTKMNNLDLLLLENVQLDGGFEDFPKGIKWLLWLRCPLKEVPLDFYFDELVVLDMQKSCLVYAWSDSKYLGALKVLNLSHSHYLRSTPDLSSAQMLEWISCEDCTSLQEVHESIGKLENLSYLNLNGCINLVTLPESKGNFKKLTRFKVKGCRNLRNLPINMLVSVECLNLDGCCSLFNRSNQVEPSAATGLENSSNVAIPTASNTCPKKSSFAVPCPPPPLPFNIFLPALKELSLKNCGISRDDVMEMICHAASLERLNLSNNPIREMTNRNKCPCCLKLKFLALQNCDISRVDDMGMMSLAPSLKYLDLSNNPIREMTNMNKCPCLKLKDLPLQNCDIARVDDMGMMSFAPSLEFLDLSNNPICVMGNMSSGAYRNLKLLVCNDSPNLQSVSNIFQGLRWLEAERSHSLKRIAYYKVPRRITTKQSHLMEAEVEMECGRSHAAIIEPILEMDEDRASYLGFPNLSTFNCAGRDNVMFERGIYQAGTYNVFLRGNHLAEWFPTMITCRRTNSGSSVSYRVPSFHPNNNDESIRALNVGFWGTSFNNITIENVSRKWAWHYQMIYNVVGNNMRLTHWYLTEHRHVRPGDELEISIMPDHCEYIGVKVIYEEEEEQMILKSSNISTSQGEDDSATTSTDVAVWYNNTFRSTDLSFFCEKEDDLEYTSYMISYPLYGQYDSDDESHTADSDDEGSTDRDCL